MSAGEPQPQDMPTPPKFDPSKPHQVRPKLRPVRGFGARNGDQVMLGLSDARQISDQVVFTVPQAQAILPHLTGESTVDEVVEKIGQGLRKEDLEMLVAQLDQAGLLEGPVFDELWSKMKAQFDSQPNLPPASTAQFADALVMQERGSDADESVLREHGPEKLRGVMDQWIDKALEKAESPSFEALPKAIIAPHLDYQRGWLNYAHTYGRMRVVDRPARIVILGTNHFGFSTGVCACDKGFESPLGTCEFDQDFADALGAALGEEKAERLFQHRYDHEREHSIELQIPWIQHVFAGDDQPAPKVFAALVHDPAVNNGSSYDGQGVDLLEFVDAMKQTIDNAEGSTLIISSADLSHVGQSFGDQHPIVGDTDEAKAFRKKVVDHDREMLQLVQEAKAEELVASMAWQQNPTRWCSVGNLVATLKITGAEKVDLLNYAMAGDQQGIAFVSSCAAAVR